MTKPRIVVWLLAIYVVILGALAGMGAPVLAYIFYGAIAVQTLVHTFWLCPRCANLCCPVNPNSKDYLLGARSGKGPSNAKTMNTNLSVLILGATFIIGLAGVWIFSELVWMFMFVVCIVLLYAYWRVACKMCTNNCVMNPNN